MGAGESGMLSPGPPTHGPLDSTPGPDQHEPIGSVPCHYFPRGRRARTVSHPGDVRAGETESDEARSVCGSRCAVGRKYTCTQQKGAIYSRAAKRALIKPSVTTPRAMPEVCRERKNSEGAGGRAASWSP